jgi:hypothetical protein
VNWVQQARNQLEFIVVFCMERDLTRVYSSIMYVMLPPLSLVPTYISFMFLVMGFDVYQMDIKSDEGMQEKDLKLCLHLEHYLYFV